MGLLDSLLGNASEVDPRRLQEEIAQVLSAGEVVEKGYQLFRDSFIFTNRRLILIDRQGMTGKKVEYRSIPYKSITQFSVETAGHFDLDAELCIWISGIPEPIRKTFNRRISVYEVQAVLASYVTR